MPRDPPVSFECPLPQSQLPNHGVAIPPHLVSHVVSETLNSCPIIQIPKSHKETLMDPEHLVPGPRPHSHPVSCVIGFNDLCAFVKNLEHFFSYNMYNIQKLQSLCSGYNAHVPTSKSVNLSASLSIVTCLHWECQGSLVLLEQDFLHILESSEKRQKATTGYDVMWELLVWRWPLTFSSNCECFCIDPFCNMHYTTAKLHSWFERSSVKRSFS